MSCSKTPENIPWAIIKNVIFQNQLYQFCLIFIEILYQLNSAKSWKKKKKKKFWFMNNCKKEKPWPLPSKAWFQSKRFMLGMYLWYKQSKFRQYLITFFKGCKSMLYFHFLTSLKRQIVLTDFGIAKWESFLHRLFYFVWSLQFRHVSLISNEFNNNFLALFVWVINLRKFIYDKITLANFEILDHLKTAFVVNNSVLL